MWHRDTHCDRNSHTGPTPRTRPRTATTGRRSAAHPLLHVVAAVLCGLTTLIAGPAAGANGVSVSITGIDSDVAARLLGGLTINNRKDTTDLSANRVRRLYQRGFDELEQGMHALGYYRPVIDGNLTRRNGGWEAVYRIYAGPPLPVEKIDIAVQGPGKDQPALTTAVERFGIKAGDTLEHAGYEQAKRALLRQALEQGYLDARLTEHQVRVDLISYSAVIAMTLETGPRYYIGPVTVSETPLDPQFVSRFIILKQGDPYLGARLIQQQNILKDTDYFAEVDIHSRRELATEMAIPIHIKLTTRKPTKYSIGLGYGTDTGPRVTLGWERRLINPQGHRMSADFKLATLRNSITGRYVIPADNPRTDFYSITTGYENEFTESSESHTFLLSAGRVVARGDWLERLSLNYHRESYTIADHTDIARLLYPAANWQYVSTDERLFAPHGYRIFFEIRGASDVLGSDVSFFQMKPQFKYIKGLWSGARLISRADLGYTSTSQFADLPASVRFFAGGDNSVRGYAYNSLGPTDDTGEVIGGRHLMVGSIEVEQRIAAKWSVAAFFDVGNAVNAIDDPVKRGAGVGLRWRSPVGQIRLDAATALSDPDRPWRLHLNIGPDL